MRSPDSLQFYDLPSEFNPKNIIPVIEAAIAVERITLEANTILGNKEECLKLKLRIIDAEILSLILSGDLPA